MTMAFIPGKLYRFGHDPRYPNTRLQTTLNVGDAGTAHVICSGATVLYLGRAFNRLFGTDVFFVMTGTGDIGYVFNLCYFEEVK